MSVNHVVSIRRRRVSVCDMRIVAGGVGFDTLSVDADDEWDELSIVIGIGAEESQVLVGYSGEPVEVPRQCVADPGWLPLSVIGYGADGVPRVVAEAAPHAIMVVEGGNVPDQPYPDQPDLLGQLVASGNAANDAADAANEAADKANEAAENLYEREFYAYPYPSDPGCCVIEYPAFLGYDGNIGVYVNLEPEVANA